MPCPGDFTVSRTVPGELERRTNVGVGNSAEWQIRELLSPLSEIRTRSEQENNIKTLIDITERNTTSRFWPRGWPLGVLTAVFAEQTILLPACPEL